MDSAVASTLIVDVDGTLAMTCNRLLEMCSRKFGHKYRLEDVARYHFRELPASVQDFIISTFADPSFYSSLRPYTAAIPVLQQAAEAGCKIVIATERPYDCYRVTEDWLGRYSIPWGELHVGPGTKKALVDKATSRMLLVDDNPATLAMHKSQFIEQRFPERLWTHDRIPAELRFSRWPALLPLLRADLQVRAA